MATINFAKGTAFKNSDMAMSPAFTQVTGVTGLTWSGRTTATQDVTSHDSTDRVKLMIPTIYDNGKYTLTYLYDPANDQHAQFKTISASGAINDFKIAKIAGGTDAFSGFVSSYQEVTDVATNMTCKVDITVYGTIANS